jgi:hypothetical protein
VRVQERGIEVEEENVPGEVASSPLIRSHVFFEPLAAEWPVMLSTAEVRTNNLGAPGDDRIGVLAYIIADRHTVIMHMHDSKKQIS